MNTPANRKAPDPGTLIGLDKKLQISRHRWPYLSLLDVGAPEPRFTDNQ